MLRSSYFSQPQNEEHASFLEIVYSVIVYANYHLQQFGKSVQFSCDLGSAVWIQFSSATVRRANCEVQFSLVSVRLGHAFSSGTVRDDSVPVQFVVKLAF